MARTYQNLALRILREQRMVETRFRVDVRKFVGSLNNAIKQYAHHIDISKITSTLVDPLTTTMAESYVLGEQRTLLIAKEQHKDITLPDGLHPDDDDTDEQDISLSAYQDAMNFLNSPTNHQQAEALKSSASAEIFTLTNNLTQKLKESADRQIGKGLHAQDAINNMLSEVSGTARAQAETIFRTENQIAYNAGVWSQTHENDILSEMLWGYEYLAVGDNRTRPEHAAMDGTRATADDPIWKVWWPPNGYNCRCSVIPIYEPSTPKLPAGYEASPDAGFAFNPALELDKETGIQTFTIPVLPEPLPTVEETSWQLQVDPAIEEPVIPKKPKLTIEEKNQLKAEKQKAKEEAAAKKAFDKLIAKQQSDAEKKAAKIKQQVEKKAAQGAKKLAQQQALAEKKAMLQAAKEQKAKELAEQKKLAEEKKEAEKNSKEYQKIFNKYDNAVYKKLGITEQTKEFKDYADKVLKDMHGVLGGFSLDVLKAYDLTDSVAETAGLITNWYNSQPPPLSSSSDNSNAVKDKSGDSKQTNSNAQPFGNPDLKWDGNLTEDILNLYQTKGYTAHEIPPTRDDFNDLIKKWEDVKENAEASIKYMPYDSLEKESGFFLHQITNEQQRAIRIYTGGPGYEFRRMNNTLRGIITDERDKAKWRKINETLQSAAEHYELPTAIRVTHGFDHDDIKSKIGVIPSKVRKGTRFKLKGFTSTSVKKRPIWGGATIYIDLPKGSKVIPAGTLALSKFTEHEQEIILPHNTELKITKVVRVDRLIDEIYAVAENLSTVPKLN